MDPHLQSPAHLAAGSATPATVAQSAADTTSVGQIMQQQVVCVTPDLDLDGLMAVLLEHEIGGAPVVDREGNPLGVVSKTDVVRACHEGTPMLTAGDIMTPISFALPESSSVARAAALMAFENVHRIVVVSGGTVVGILSSLDVLRWLARGSGYLLPG